MLAQRAFRVSVAVLLLEAASAGPAPAAGRPAESRERLRKQWPAAWIAAADGPG